MPLKAILILLAFVLATVFFGHAWLAHWRRGRRVGGTHLAVRWLLAIGVVGTVAGTAGSFLHTLLGGSSLGEWKAAVEPMASSVGVIFGAGVTMMAMTGIADPDEIDPLLGNPPHDPSPGRPLDVARSPGDPSAREDRRA